MCEEYGDQCRRYRPQQQPVTEGWLIQRCGHVGDEGERRYLQIGTGQWCGAIYATLFPLRETAITYAIEFGYEIEKTATRGEVQAKEMTTVIGTSPNHCQPNIAVVGMAGQAQKTVRSSAGDANPSLLYTFRIHTGPYLTCPADIHEHGDLPALVLLVLQRLTRLPLGPKGRQTLCRWREPPDEESHPTSPPIRLAA